MLRHDTMYHAHAALHIQAGTYSFACRQHAESAVYKAPGASPPPLAHRDGNTVVPCRAGLHVLMAIEGTSHVLCMTEHRHLCICACEYLSMHVRMHVIM